MILKSFTIQNNGQAGLIGHILSVKLLSILTYTATAQRIVAQTCATFEHTIFMHWRYSLHTVVQVWLIRIMNIEVILDMT